MMKKDGVVLCFFGDGAGGARFLDEIVGLLEASAQALP